MKDVKGHGSNPKQQGMDWDKFGKPADKKPGSAEMDWNKEDMQNAAAERGGRAAHQAAVEDVGKLKGWEAAIKNQVAKFGKSTSGAGRDIPGAGEGFDPGDVGEWFGRIGTHIANNKVPNANELAELATRIAPHMIS